MTLPCPSLALPQTSCSMCHDTLPFNPVIESAIFRAVVPLAGGLAGRCRVRPQKGPGTLAGDGSRASGGTQGGLNGGGRVAKRPIPVSRGVVRG